jgi:F-box/leucine-rich repeat protein 2/20
VHFSRFFKRLVGLDLTGSGVTRLGLDFLIQQEPLVLYELESLVLVNILSLDDSVLQGIGSCCPRLKILDLSVFASESKFTDSGLIKIAQGCPRLEVLNLTGSPPLSNRTLSALGSCCKELKDLDLSGAFGVDDSGLLELVKGCLKLETLIVSYCWRITDSFFEEMTSKEDKYLRNLEALSVSFCYQLTDRVVDFLLELPRLKSVNLSYCGNIQDPSKFRLLQKSIYVS